MAGFALNTDQVEYVDRVRALATEHLLTLVDSGEPGRVNRPLLAMMGDLGLLRDLFGGAPDEAPRQ